MSVPTWRNAMPPLCSSSRVSGAIRSPCSSRLTDPRSSVGPTFRSTIRSRDAGSSSCSPTWPGATGSSAPPSCAAPRWCGSVQGRRGGVRGGGALKPAAVQREAQAVRGLTAAAARTHADIASFRFTQAVDLLLAVSARTGDSAYLAPARAVLDCLVDPGDAGRAPRARDEPPELVRAGLLRDLVLAWSATG